jgi:hypothetical protein
LVGAGVEETDGVIEGVTDGDGVNVGVGVGVFVGVGDGLEGIGYNAMGASKSPKY